MGLHFWKGIINAERYTRGFRETCSHWDDPFFQRSPCIFQQHNAELHAASLTTAWHYSRRATETAGSGAELPAVQGFHIENNLRIAKCKISQNVTQDCGAARNQDRATFQKSSSCCPRIPDVYVLLIEEGMLHGGPQTRCSIQTQNDLILSLKVFFRYVFYILCK